MCTAADENEVEGAQEFGKWLVQGFTEYRSRCKEKVLMVEVERESAAKKEVEKHTCQRTGTKHVIKVSTPRVRTREAERLGCPLGGQDFWSLKA
jgi:hypothetical protein